MALSIARITIELREILLKDRPTSLFEISPKGTVPVLRTADKTFEESMDIIYWALDHSNKLEVFFDNKETQKKLIKQNDNEFKKWLDRYKYHSRNKQYSIEECKNNAGQIIDKYEKKLTKSKYLINNRIQISDISIFPFIRQFAFVDMEYFNMSYPKTSVWLHGIIASKLFKSVMSKYEVWTPSSNPHIINFAIDN